MNFSEARAEVMQSSNRVDPRDLQKVSNWIRTSDQSDESSSDNRKVISQNISEHSRVRSPPEAMLPSETTAYSKMQQRIRPTLHVDGFSYDEDQVDASCEEGTMSRSYCSSCGSYRTAPSDFSSHSFSVSELQFSFENVLPDSSGRTSVDVGSRSGAVSYGGHVFSSASRLVGLEINEEFVKSQQEVSNKYKMTDRTQVLHTDVCSQNISLQNADVLIMNNVFEFFMEPSEQVGAWRFIMENFRKKGASSVTVPASEDSSNASQGASQPGWVEELPVDYDVYSGRDVDPEALRQIHSYRVI